MFTVFPIKVFDTVLPVKSRKPLSHMVKTKTDAKNAVRQKAVPASIMDYEGLMPKIMETV